MARHAEPVTPRDDATPDDATPDGDTTPDDDATPGGDTTPDDDATPDGDAMPGGDTVSADIGEPARSRRRDSLGIIMLLWVGGLVVGLFAVLGVAARFTCAPGATGTACRPVGTAVGVVLVLAVVVVVAVGTVSLSDSPTWPSRGGRLALAAVALIATYLAAHALLLTA